VRCSFFAIVIGFLGSSYILMDELGGASRAELPMLPYETSSRATCAD
jgi:hypothetical protein